jgi:hypothetical protein
VTPSQLNQRARFLALAPVGAEPLVTGGVTIQALVDRLPTKRRLEMYIGDKSFDFTMQGISTIEILFTALGSSPVAGQTFLDSNNIRHRVKIVQQTDIAWICICNVSSNS